VPPVTIGSCVSSVGPPEKNVLVADARVAVKIADGPLRYESKNSSSPSAVIVGLPSVDGAFTSSSSRTNEKSSPRSARDANATSRSRASGGRRHASTC
jgi:hypothetical protein